MQQRADDPFDLDGRVFDMVSSTASRVDPQSPTRFAYHEDRGVVWGEYSGDTVVLGRFVGTRVEDRLTVSFVHARTAGGPPVGGEASSRVERADAGMLRLVEEFEAGGALQTSVCTQIHPTP